MKKCWQIIAGVLAIVLANIAGGGGGSVTPVNFANTPTPTMMKVLATQTPYFVEITTTPEPTGTPTEVLAKPSKCIQSLVTVYLRPSANTSGYPIEVLANGDRVVELGGRVGNMVFVSHGDKQGWVHSDYLTTCSS